MKLSISHLSKQYRRDFWGLRNFDLELTPGVIGLLGPNGAGKSTLMYTLSGIMLDIKKKEEMRGGERITLFGSLTFEGKDISNLPAHRRAKAGIVLCPERRRIFPESSVLENLRIGAYRIVRELGKGGMGTLQSWIKWSR